MPPYSIPTATPIIPHPPISSRLSQMASIWTWLTLYWALMLVQLALWAYCIRYAISYRIRKNQRTATNACVTLREKDEPPPPYREKDTVQPVFKPIYPWVAPPRALPGPYDPRLYPPIRTIRRHSQPAPLQGETIQSNTVYYARRVSTNNIPDQKSTLRGSITHISDGTSSWRRNQWAVEG
ncbi:hypothetical protein GQ43DRAFT_279883 [Delitschia confertaspora ATCC 74209]|uniref:Uncharacterized protein n=1 Tax=Delitschia confertaspora ATCC 74209 TaxID=1513339 RepID=A0A9P4MTE5_9PLEO|nr:hypothetical protein GQ43DRAFT_279883 [Delitschia confertaspora ATCC 74209]